MDIVESIERYIAGTDLTPGTRTRLVRARDEIVRLRKNQLTPAPEQPAQQEPVAWGMPGKDGFIFDVICPEEHTREEGGYTVPLYTTPPAAPVQEHMNWREHVEQRIRTWRQRTMNKCGDMLAIDDFMGQDSIDDLVDFVCDEWTDPPAAQRQWVGLTDEEENALIPEPDGSAEANVKRVEVLPGAWGKEYDVVDAWSKPLVLQMLRDHEAKLREKNA